MMCCFKTPGENIVLIQNYFELLTENYNKPKLHFFFKDDSKTLKTGTAHLSKAVYFLGVYTCRPINRIIQIYLYDATALKRKQYMKKLCILL